MAPVRIRWTLVQSSEPAHISTVFDRNHRSQGFTINRVLHDAKQPVEYSSGSQRESQDPLGGCEMPSKKQISKVNWMCIFNQLLFKFWLYSLCNYFKITLGCCSLNVLAYWYQCLHRPNSACARRYICHHWGRWGSSVRGTVILGVTGWNPLETPGI